MLSRPTKDAHNSGRPNRISNFNGIAFEKCLSMKCDVHKCYSVLVDTF